MNLAIIDIPFYSIYFESDLILFRPRTKKHVDDDDDDDDDD